VSTSATARLGTGTNRQRKLHRLSSSSSGLVAALLVHERAHCGQQGPRSSLVATALLDKYEGLRSPCGCLMTTSVVGLRRQLCLVVMALLVECKGLRSPCGRLITTSVVSLRRQHCLMATALLVECEGLAAPAAVS
jgi:hypothetical protein